MMVLTKEYWMKRAALRLVMRRSRFPVRTRMKEVKLFGDNDVMLRNMRQIRIAEAMNILRILRILKKKDRPYLRAASTLKCRCCRLLDASVRTA
jgi:hypothetical protein